MPIIIEIWLLVLFDSLGHRTCTWKTSLFLCCADTWSQVMCICARDPWNLAYVRGLVRPSAIVSMGFQRPLRPDWRGVGCQCVWFFECKTGLWASAIEPWLPPFRGIALTVGFNPFLSGLMLTCLEVCSPPQTVAYESRVERWRSTPTSGVDCCVLLVGLKKSPKFGPMEAQPRCFFCCQSECFVLGLRWWYTVDCLFEHQLTGPPFTWRWNLMLICDCLCLRPNQSSSILR